MKWLKYPENTPPERIQLFGKNEENRLQVVKYFNGKFDTYCKIIYFCVPDPTEEITDDIEQPIKKKRGRPKKT